MSLACSSTCTCRLYSELCCSLHILLSFHSFSDYPSDLKILLPLSCRWIQFYPPKQTVIKAASLWSLELHQGIFSNMGGIYPWDKSCYFCRWHRHRSCLWTKKKKFSFYYIEREKKAELSMIISAIILKHIPYNELRIVTSVLCMFRCLILTTNPFHREEMKTQRD